MYQYSTLFNTNKDKTHKYIYSASAPAPAPHPAPAPQTHPFPLFINERLHPHQTFKKTIYFLQQNPQTTDQLQKCTVTPLFSAPPPAPHPAPHPHPAPGPAPEPTALGFKFSHANESNRVHLLTQSQQWPTNQKWKSTKKPPSFYKLPSITSKQTLIINVDVNLQAAKKKKFSKELVGAECGSVLSIYLVPTRKTPPKKVDPHTNGCTDYYTDAANLCGIPRVETTCGLKGKNCLYTPCPASGAPCGSYQSTWSCKPGPADHTGCNMGVELDLFEGNKYGFQCTTHSCLGLGDPTSATYQPNCDQWGNISAGGYIPRNPSNSPYSKGWQYGKNFGPGTNFTINSLKTFTVSAEISLDALSVTLTQGLDTSKPDFFTYGTLNFEQGNLSTKIPVAERAAAIKHALQNGELSLIFSYWGNADLSNCTSSPKKNCPIDPDSVWLTTEGAGDGSHIPSWAPKTWGRGSLCQKTNPKGLTGPVSISNINILIWNQAGRSKPNMHRRWDR